MIEAADLAVFLVLQLRELAALAGALDRPDDARRWRATAGTVRAAMLRDLWHDGRFVSRSPSSGRRRTSSSLLDLKPIVLGDDLPPGVGAELACLHLDRERLPHPGRGPPAADDLTCAAAATHDRDGRPFRGEVS